MKQKPNKTVIRINCPICGELQLKIYPWGNFSVNTNMPIPPCKKHIK